MHDVVLIMRGVTVMTRARIDGRCRIGGKGRACTRRDRRRRDDASSWWEKMAWKIEILTRQGMRVRGGRVRCQVVWGIWVQCQMRLV